MKFVDTGLDGPEESLERWLLPLLPSAELLAAQSGFFSLAGWNLVAGAIRSLLERGGQVHLVVGGRPEQSDPQGMRAALDLLSQYPEAATFVVVNDVAAMHTAKTYYVRSTAGDEYCWVGSANLTGRGMKVNYQAGIQLGPEDDSEHARRVLEAVSAWRTGERPAMKVDERYIRELWPVARTGVFNTPPSPPRLLKDSIERTLDVIEAVDAAPHRHKGLPTGFSDLDHLLYGFHPGELVIVGGDQAMGKTALLLQFVRASAKAGTPAGYLTLQTTVDEINLKLLAAEASVPHHHLRGGLMTDDDWSRVAKKMGPVAQLPIYIASHPMLTLDQLLLQIEDLANNDAQLVAVDMATQITVPDAESREHELTLVSSALKAIALQLQITMVAAWPLGRGLHQRSDKRPVVQDLWGTSQCERDADVIILLHREDAYWLESTRPGEADLTVAKHRHGPPADIVAAFQPHYGRFADLAP